MNSEKLKLIISNSLNDWASILSAIPNMSNPEKSEYWVSCLAGQLAREYLAPEYKVFPPAVDCANSTYKNRYEFLFDIHVCKTSKFSSISQNIDVNFVSGSEMAIESEFKRLTPHAAEDLSKLVCSNARTRLFIGPYIVPGKDNLYLNPLLDVIKFIEPLESFWFAMVMNPEDIVDPKDVTSKWRLMQVQKDHNGKCIWVQQYP